MVAVISGNGLGLGNTSLQSQGTSQGGAAGLGQAGAASYVNSATGNLILQSADEGLLFDGLPLNVLRTYNSLGQLNDGWSYGFSRTVSGLTGTVNTAGSTITRTADDGSTTTYAYNASLGVYVSEGQSGASDTLSWNATASNWTWTDAAAQQQETYNASGQLTRLTGTATGASYSFSYSGSQLSQIVAGDGDTLLLGYNTSQQLISLSIQAIPPGQTTAVTRQAVSYGYDAQGRLSTVTTTLGSDTDSTTASYTTTYAYQGSTDLVASVTQSDGTTVSYSYTEDAQGVYQVTAITTGTGAAAQTVTLSYGAGSTTVTDGLGHTTTYQSNAAGQLTAVIAPPVNGTSPTTRYTYDANGNLLTLTDADGAVTTYQYDANGNLLSGEDGSGHTVSYTYNAADQVTSQTTYTVPAQGVVGQSGYVAPSGAQTTYYVYNASGQLAYVVDALGNVTEHDYTTSNGIAVLSSTEQYVGATYSLTGLSPSTPPTLGQVQNWVASSPVQAVLGQMVRTDYSYDVRGQLSQSIQWDTLSSSGVGTLSSDVGAVVTRYTYDAQGRLLQSSTETGANRTTLQTTSYAYDGLGRLISSTDPLGHVTSYAYTDSANTLAITQANGLITTQVRNSAGQLISSTSSASGQTSRVTSYLYNADGQQVATIDPAGNVSYTFYDADGRVAGTVDATGAVTAYTYDADGQAIATTQYATLINTAGWVSGGALTASLPASLPVPSTNAGDRTAHVLYDAAGRVIATIDAQGYVTTTAYDGDGNAISTRAYATALTSVQLTALGDSPSGSTLQADLTSSVNDRTTRTIYDADNQPVASIDAAGYVTVMTYDDAGRLTKTMAYATALTSAQLTALGSSPTLAALQADLTTSSNDQTTRIYADGDGRVVAQIDADGYLTTITYSTTTNTTTTTRYATALTSAQLGALTGSESVATLVGLLGSATSNEQSSVTTNAEGQTVSSTAVDGTVTTYVYNAVGQLTASTVTPANGQGTARSTGTTYDAFGDTLTTTDGNSKVTTYTYNTLGQRITATDALGNVTTTYYDADGRIAYIVQGQPSGSTRNALGDVTAYTYNAFSQVATTRRYAGMLTLTTSGSSSGTTVNLSAATTATLATAAAALANPATDRTTTTNYTLDGQVASTTDGLGYQTAYQYDAFGDVLQTQQQLSQPGSALSAANSTITTATYDNRGEQLSQTAGAGTSVARTTSATYDAFGRVTQSTDGNGNVVSYSYDALGRQVSSSQTVQGTARTTHTTYDAFDRVVTQTDALGNVTSYQYDMADHKTIVTTGDGVTMTTVTDAFGDTVSVTDGAGDITRYTYDGDGRLLTTTDALGNTSTHQYDADGDLIQTTDATGHLVTYSYDASGRVLTQTVDPSGLNLTTTYSYDGQGRELSVTDPTGVVTTYSYDADGNTLTQVQDAGSGKLNLTTTYTYDGAGKTLTVTVGAGTSAARTTQYVYDNLERLSQQIVDPGTGHLNLTTRYAYDANDNLISVTDANGQVTRTVYNEANQAVLTINAVGAVTQATYDADGRVTSTRAYATALTSAQLSALGTAPTVAQVSADLTASSSDQVSYTAYNAEGQVRYSIDPMGYVTETRYDSAGRVSETLTYATPVSVTTDEATVLQQAQGTALSSVATLVSNAGNTDANAHATLTLYDADGQVRFTVQQNTVNGQLVGVVSEQRYDAAGRVVASIAYGSTLTLSSSASLSAQLSTASVTQALASAPSHVTYAVYDNAGRQVYSIDPTGHVTQTQVDHDGRVLETIAYANAITVPGTQTVATLAAAISATNSGTTGARISTTTYDDAGRVLTTGDALGVNATYTYDATGLTLTSTNRDGAKWTYSYDAAGRQVLVQSPAVTVGSYSGSTLQTAANQYLYTRTSYDGVGQVLSVSTGSGPSATQITVASTTTYAYDAVGHRIQTTNALGKSSTTTYNALGQAVVGKDANGNTTYRIYNADGELAYAVDGNGYATATTYDAYGNVLTQTAYANALNATAISGWSAGQPLGLAQVQAGLVTSASDRTTTTTYNQRNQTIQIQQPSIAYVLTEGALAGQSAVGSPTTTYTYDAYGNQTSSATLIQGALTVGATTTPAIWATTYTYYDALDRAVMMVTPTGLYTSPQGYVTTTSYDAFGDVLSTTQYATAISTSSITTATPPGLPPAGTVTTGYDRTTTYAYDSLGRTTSETDAGEYSYTGGTLGQPNGTAGIASASSVTQYTYDGENRVTSITVNGATTTTTYDAAGRVLTVTGPARQALVSNWQSLLESTPGDDLTSAALYTSVSPVTSYVYDALGDALSTAVSGGGLSQQTLSYYNALGQRTELLDANGNARTTTYDNNGNVLTQSYTLTGATTVITTNVYDADNRLLSSAVQRSGVSTYDSYTQQKYNAFGNVIATGDNSGYEAQYSYNNAGQLITAPDAKTGAAHSYSYDLAGHQGVDSVYVTGGSQPALTISTLDLGGHVIARTTPSSSAAIGTNASTQTYSYDRWGNVLSATDELGNTTQYEYDSQNQLIKQTEAYVLVVSATGTDTWTTPTKEWYYNTNGQLMAVTDENGNTSWNTYDAAGNLTIAQDNTGARTYTGFDALGRAVAQQTPPVQTATGTLANITYTTYDNLNQVIGQGDFQLNTAGTARVQVAQGIYVLDINGDRIRSTDALGNVITYTYDSQGRVLTSITPLNEVTSYAYDVNGNLVQETDADGHTQTWAYNYFKQLLTHVDASGATYTYTYDASSGLLTKETSNWTATGPSGSITSTLNFSYEADGQLAALNETVNGIASSYTYGYDADGNETLETDSTQDGSGAVVTGQTIITYDSHNRLAEVTDENGAGTSTSMRTDYIYDADGNRRAAFAQNAYGSTASPITGNGGPPTTAGVGTQTAPPGQAWNDSIASAFTDNIGFGLTFTGSGFPSWLSLSSNGTLSGTPTTAGSWTVSVTATDVNGKSVSTTFVVTVPVAAPVFTAGASNQTGSVGAALNFSAPVATDANGAALTYSATCNGGSLPSWLSFNTSTLAFAGTPPAGSVGSYSLAVKATAANGGTATESFTLTVAPTPPVYVSGVSSQTAFGGHTSSFSFAASDFSEPDGDTLAFTAGSYSMNGSVETDSALPSWMSLSVSGGNLIFTTTPPTSVVGQSFSIYIKGTNPQGQAAEAHFTVTVAQYVQPPPVYNGGMPNQTGVIGGASLNIGLPANSFVEPDGGALSYTGMVLIPAHTLTINKGGEPTATNVPAAWVPISEVGLTVNATTGAITGVPAALSYETVDFSTPEYTYASAYQIQITATNGQGGAVSGSFTLTNSYAPPAVANPMPAQTVTPGTGWAYAIPANTFTDAAPGALTYTVSNLPSWMSFSNGEFSASASAAEPSGTYSITVIATDSQGHAGSTTLTINVPNVPPVFTAPASNITVTQYEAFSYQPPAVTDPNGDAVGYDATYGPNYAALPSWITFDKSTHTFSGTPPTAGTFAFQMWGGDSAGNLIAEGFTITVSANPQPPQYVGTINGKVFQFFSPKSASINAANQFTDPQGGALTYTATYPSWLTFNASTQTFSGNPNLHNDSYVTYACTLTATDSNGLSTTISFTIGYQGPASAQVVNAQTLSAQTQTTQATQTTTPNIQADWFTYDADGRVLVANGSLENGQIVITSGLNSGQNTYDAAGDLASYTTINASGQTTTQRGVYNVQGEETQLQTQTTTGGSYAAYESKSYDADGHLISTVTYQLPGSLEAGVYNGAPVSFSDAGWIKSDLIETYNADGEVVDQSEYDEDSAQDLINAYGTGVATSAYASQDQSAPGSLPSVGSGTDGALYLSSDYSYASGSGLGYDKDGNLLGYVVITSGHNTVVNPSASATTTTYQNQYVWQNNALNSSTTATSSGGTTSNTNTYNDLGELVETSGTLDGTAQTNALAYTADAQVLQKTISSDGATTFSTFMYANEQGLGSVNNQGVINILATTGGFTNSQLGTQSYTVATGDTLQSLAQKIYGDSNYSYILAEANGLQADSPLTVGLSLKIPQVTTTANTTHTFQPYAQSAIVNGSSSACLTTAQIVVTSIQAVLNQQSAFAQTVQNVEQAYQAQEQQLQAIATAQAAQAAAAAKEAQADQALQLAQKEQVADHILDQGDVTEKRNETALLHGIGVLGDGLIWGQISDGSDYATDVGGGAFGGGGGDDDGILPINLGPGDILGEENLTPDESYGAQEIDQLESIDNEAAAIEDSANSAYDRQLAAYDSAEDDYNEGEANLASADAEQSSAGSPNDVDTLSTAVGGPAFTAYTNWYGNLSVSGATGGEDGVGEANWVASQTGIEPTSWAGLAGGDASSGIFDGGGTGEGGFGNALGNAAIVGINAYQANQLPPISVDTPQPAQQISASDFDTNVQDMPQTIAPVAVAQSVDAQEQASQSVSTADGGVASNGIEPINVDIRDVMPQELPAVNAIADLVPANIPAVYPDDLTGSIEATASSPSISGASSTSYRLGTTDWAGLGNTFFGAATEGGKYLGELGNLGVGIGLVPPKGYTSFLLAGGEGAAELMPSPGLRMLWGAPSAGSEVDALYLATNLSQLKPALGVLGDISAIAGPGIELYSWTNQSTVTPGDVGHLGVTSSVAWASWAAGGLPGVVLGAGWAVLDTSAQAYHYTPMYGPYQGSEINGWSAIWSTNLDNHELQVSQLMLQHPEYSNQDAENAAAIQNVIDIGK